jgi:hypothetical protein
MPHYLVTWEIDVWADTPERAAQDARTIQRHPQSTATVFTVTTDDGDATAIDLADTDTEAPRS